MGAGAVLREAHAELARLPADAWERTVAMPLLIALRFEIPHPCTEDEKEYLMSTQELYEQWMQQVETKGLERGVKQGLERGVKQGLEQGAKQMLITVYKARFGTMPPDVVTAIDAMHDTATLSRWAELISTRSADEIAASVRGGTMPLS
jgi:flagellar biosynthesis/type III secretory pathway protein FliH